ncbi:MAG: hypothetical protein ACEY3J_01730 [Arsenophonus sp.]
MAKDKYLAGNNILLMINHYSLAGAVKTHFYLNISALSLDE